MKLFGLEINKSKSSSLSDEVVVTTVTPSNTIPISKIPSIRPKVLHYGQTFARGRGNFTPGEYDLAEIGKIEDTDCFVRQSFKKKKGLMFKEGAGYSGANKDTIRYVKTRMAQISRATRIPQLQLMKRIAESLIRTSNAFLIKARNPRASGGKIRVDADGKTLKPIAGYFPAAPETMRVDIDQENGRLRRWKQILPDGRFKFFPIQDVVHFHIDRREGFIFGIPTIIPVIDDIRALRQIEENIELLLYQNLFPLFHYKVGTETAPAGLTEDGDKEVEIVEQQIRFMPSEGAIVTPERHEIKAIGAEGRALRAEGYLEHFKKRVFAGLGVSSVDMGDGDCYDELTQTLTETGWKYHWEIDHKKEKIGTYNPEAKQIEFHQANYKYEGLYQGDMILFQGQHLDIKVSPKHEMWVKPKVRLGQDPKIFEKVQAIDIFNEDYDSEFYMMESASFIEDNSVIDQIVINKTSYNLNYFAKFLGYFISEGCLDKYNAEQNKYRTNLYQNKGPVLDDMLGVLDRLNFSHNLSFTRQNQGSVKIYNKALYKWLEQRVGHKAANKNLPQEVFTWTKKARAKLFSSLMAGDGTVSSLPGRTSQTYYTTSVQLADDVQRLALSLGYAAKVKETQQSKGSKNPEGTIWRVHISGSGNGPVIRLVTRENIRIEKYNKTIYCYNVPNHLFVTRRNGKVTIQGNTTNRATANTLSRALIDAVKDVQDAFEAQWDHEIISELLLESTFGADVLEEESMVKLRFHEIDIQNKMEQEKHAAEMFEGNGLTYDEYRAELNREPIPIPDDPQDQDLTKFTEWSLTNWKLFKEPEFLIKAVDEPYSAAAQAASESRSMAVTAKGQAVAQKAKEGDETRAAEEDRKTKIAVTKAKPVVKKDNFLASGYRDLETDTINRVKLGIQTRGRVDRDHILSMGRVWAQDMSDKLQSTAIAKMINGFNDQTGSKSSEAELLINMGREVIKERIGLRIDKLVEFTVNLIKRRVDSIDGNVKLTDIQNTILREVHNAFDTTRFRTDFIWDVELRKAYNYGRVLGLRFLDEFGIKVTAKEGSCDRCTAMSGLITRTVLVDIDSLVPHHAHCSCEMTVVRPGD